MPQSRMSSGIWPYPNSSSNHPVAVLDSKNKYSRMVWPPK